MKTNLEFGAFFLTCPTNLSMPTVEPKGVPEQLYEACVYNVTNHMNQLVKDGRAKEAFIQEKKVYLRTATG